jgi:hypothetical protein
MNELLTIVGGVVVAILGVVILGKALWQGLKDIFND